MTISADTKSFQFGAKVTKAENGYILCMEKEFSVELTEEQKAENKKVPAFADAPNPAKKFEERMVVSSSLEAVLGEITNYFKA